MLYASDLGEQVINMRIARDSESSADVSPHLGVQRRTSAWSAAVVKKRSCKIRARMVGRRNIDDNPRVNGLVPCQMPCVFSAYHSTCRGLEASWQILSDKRRGIHGCGLTSGHWSSHSLHRRPIPLCPIFEHCPFRPRPHVYLHSSVGSSIVVCTITVTP